MKTIDLHGEEQLSEFDDLAKIVSSYKDMPLRFDISILPVNLKHPLFFTKVRFFCKYLLRSILCLLY